MLTEFFAWWGGQLRELLPDRLRRDPARDNALIVTPEGPPAALHAIALSQRRQGTEAFLGRFAPDAAGMQRLRAAPVARARTTVLRLPAEWLLHREVTLPLAAERQPRRVLHYDMDRLTPFASDALFWGYAPLRRDKARGRLHLLLFFMPRAALAPLLELLDQAGLPPAALEAPTQIGTRTIPLDTAEAVAPTWQDRATMGLQAACVVLAVTAVVLPFLRQSLALAAVQDRIEALRPRTERAEALRARLTGAASGTDVVTAERARLGDTLQVLAAVTDILPDDTFLSDLSLHQGKLGIAGQSAAAAKLIAALSAEPILRNPSFVAPVTRVDNGAADQFSIRAELAP